MRRLALKVLVVLCFGWPTLGFADDWAIASPSVITFYVDHPMHNVVAVSSKPRGNLAWSPSNATDFTQLVGRYIQVDWASFDSDNANRDENIRTYVNARKFPTLTYKVTGVRDAVLEAAGSVRAVVEGLLYCNGQKKPIAATFHVTSVGDTITLRAEFEGKMTDFGIEPPSLMFMQAQDAFRVETSLTLQPAAKP